HANPYLVRVTISGSSLVPASAGRLANALPERSARGARGQGGGRGGCVCTRSRVGWQHGGVAVPVETELPEATEASEPVLEPDVPWVTVVHNAPVNLMSYVTYVFQSYFGYSKDKAHEL